MENTLVETIEYKGKQIQIFQDENSTNPRMDDNLGVMICFHPRYDLGDKHSYDLEEAQALFADKQNIALALYLYDHSGITMNTIDFACQFDSSQVGIIFVTKEDIRKEYGWKRITKARHEQICSYLKGEVSLYDNYLTGNVYGYTVDDEHTCWGFFGNNFEKNGLLEQAKSEIDYTIAEELKSNPQLEIPLDNSAKEKNDLIAEL